MTSKILSLVLILVAGLGCGIADRVRQAAEGESNRAVSANANKTFTDSAVETAVGDAKIGIPECDEVMELVQAELNNPDDNMVTKAIKATVLNRIKDGIREGVAKNQNSNSAKDVEEMAKTCREFRTQFDKYKADEQKKAAPQ